MPDFFSTPDDLGEIRQSELHASLGESLAAQARNSLPSLDVFHRLRLENASGGNIGVPGAGGELDVFSGQPLEERQAASQAFRDAVPDTPIADAKARVKQEGLEGHLKLPDQPGIKSPVLDLMIQHAHDQRDREVAIAKGPSGFIPGALGLVTSLGVGMIDPINIAAFSIPVLGEARMGRLIASAGDSMLARAGIKAGIGAAQGAVGTTALQPLDWWLHTQDGQDYTFADALKSIVMGAGMGAGFHAGFGAIGDSWRRTGGKPLKGSPEDLLVRGLMAGRHVPADVLAEEGVTGQELGDAFAPPEGITHPAEALADLPPAAREDAFRATVADIAADRPVRAAEMLQIAADHDPRIAESIEAPRRGLDARTIEERPGEIPARLDQLAALARDEHPQHQAIVVDHVRNPDELAAAAGLNVDLAGYRHTVDTSAIRHTLNAHGDPAREAARGQVAVVPEDIRLVPEIVGNPDRVEPVEWGRRDSNVKLRYVKQIDDVYYYVEEVRMGRRELAMATMYKRPAGKDGEGNTRPDAAGGAAGPQDPTSENVVRPEDNVGPESAARNPQSHGPQSHGARAALAAEDPRWRELADVPPAHSTPEAIAESQAGDAVAEPASTTPKALSAVEQAATEAVDSWRRIENSYTEAERALVNDALAKIEAERKAREQLISDGAACLAAAEVA